MGILRLLIVTIVIMAICLAILPRTTKEQKIERGILKTIIAISIAFIIIFSIALIQFKESLWKTSPSNHPLIKKILYNETDKIFITNLDMQSVDKAALENALIQAKNSKRLIIKNIDEKDIEYINNALVKNPNINTLEIKELSISASKVLATALPKSNITQLKITGIPTDNLEIILKSLTQSHKLESLEIFDTSINLESARFIRDLLNSNQKLIKLDLQFDSIDDKELKIISENLSKVKNLQVINLWGNKITSEGAEYLLKQLELNNSVEELLLGYNQISTSSMNSLANLIVINQHIKLIDLTRNPISDDALEIIYPAVKQNSGLEKIIIRSSLFTDKTKLFTRKLEEEKEKRILIEY